MTKHDTVMKRNTIIPAASALALLLGLASLRASAQVQTQLSGNTLNIWRDTAITVSNTGVMSISAGQGALNVTGGNFSVNGSRLDVGTTDQPRFVMTSQGTPAAMSSPLPWAMPTSTTVSLM